MKSINNNNLKERVHVVNSIGAIVFESRLNNQKMEDDITVDLPRLPDGIYFVSVFEDDNLVRLKKLLVQ